MQILCFKHYTSDVLRNEYGYSNIILPHPLTSEDKTTILKPLQAS